MTAPEWLTQRGGDLKLASDGRTWYFLLGGQPQYSLTAVPVAGYWNGSMWRYGPMFPTTSG